MDLETRVRRTIEARAAAGWTTGIVMFAAFAYGVATEDETGYWLLFIVAVVGIGLFLWLDNHLTALRSAATAVTEAPTDELRRKLEASAPAVSAAESPGLVSSIIGLTGVVIGGVMSLAG